MSEQLRSGSSYLLAGLAWRTGPPDWKGRSDRNTGNIVIRCDFSVAPGQTQSISTFGRISSEIMPLHRLKRRLIAQVTRAKVSKERDPSWRWIGLHLRLHEILIAGISGVMLRRDFSRRCECETQPSRSSCAHGPPCAAGSIPMI